MTSELANQVSHLTEQLALYIGEAAHRPLPPHVAERTKHHVLDTVAAIVSGSGLVPGRKGIAMATALGGFPEATVFGSKIVTNAVNAAFANGMSGHADETDDSHAPSMTHPGCSIVPAAWAMGERKQSAGAAVLRAVALGYDVSARLSFSIGAERFRRVGHSTHSIAPTFGAAAAGAALAGFGSEQVRHVLSYAAQQASGLSCYTRDVHHVEKAFDFGGMPARNGVTAAFMVDLGCTAVDDVFFGERGFFEANNEELRIGIPPRPELLVHELGTSFEIMNTNIKRWSVGSPIQAPLDSLLEIIKSHKVSAADVDHLTVRVSELGAVTTDNATMPDICMQHLCAVMLVDGRVTFESSHDASRMHDPEVLSVRRKITLIGSAELQALLPHRHGIVDLRLKDGTTLQHHTSAVRGSAQNPMSREEVAEKCYHLMATVLGSDRAQRVCDVILSIEDVADIRELRPLLQA